MDRPALLARLRVLLHALLAVELEVEGAVKDYIKSIFEEVPRRHRAPLPYERRRLCLTDFHDRVIMEHTR